VCAGERLCFSRSAALLNRFEVGGQRGHRNQACGILASLFAPGMLLVLGVMELCGVLMPGDDVPELSERSDRDGVCLDAGGRLDEGVRMAQLPSGVMAPLGRASMASMAIRDVTRWFVSCAMTILLILFPG
jgi:hypothetical protein